VVVVVMWWWVACAWWRRIERPKKSVVLCARVLVAYWSMRTRGIGTCERVVGVPNKKGILIVDTYYKRVSPLSGHLAL
jgi:hypothetical protein